ncbi:MAG: hypothetical protein V3V29_09740 [Acidimicrobiia bacterium]
MTQVRRPLLAALALFTAAITLDRMGVGSGQVVATHAYVIALLAIALPFVSPSMRRSGPLVVPIVAAAGLLGYSAASASGFFGQGAAHAAATEVALVALGGWLGCRLSTALDQMDDLLATAALGEPVAIDLSGPAAANEIRVELARSRRHDRPLSVTVLAPTPRGLARAVESTSLQVDRSVRTRFLFGALAHTVASQLRRSDLLFEHRPSRRLIVLSPETNGEGTSLLVERILDATARSGIETTAGSACFPMDGIGFDSLVAHAEAEMAADPAPRLRAVEPGGTA